MKDINNDIDIVIKTKNIIKATNEIAVATNEEINIEDPVDAKELAAAYNHLMEAFSNNGQNSGVPKGSITIEWDD